MSAALILLAAAEPASADDLELRDVELPGLTVALPLDKPLRGSIGTVTSGHFRLGVVGASSRSNVTLQWTIGAVHESDDIVALVKANIDDNSVSVRPVAPEKFSVGGGLLQRSAAVSTDNSTEYVTIFGCGARRFIIRTGGNESESLHARIVASVRCLPGANGDADVVVPVILDLRAGWSRDESKPGSLKFVNERSKNELVIHAEVGGPVDLDRMAKERKDLWKGTVAGKRVVRGRDIRSASIVRNDEKVDVLFTAVPCPDRKITLVLWSKRPLGSDEKLGLQVLLGARCPAPGEKIREYGGSSASRKTPGSSVPVPAPTTPPTTVTADELGDDLGVPECDKYFAVMDSCAGKMPAQTKVMREMLADLKKVLRKVVQKPGGREQTATNCLKLFESAKAAYTPEGCAF